MNKYIQQNAFGATYMFNINVWLKILGRVYVKGQISGFYKDTDILNSECHTVNCSNYLPIKGNYEHWHGKIQEKSNSFLEKDS